MNFYLIIEVKKGGGGAQVHVYVLEHTSSQRQGFASSSAPQKARS